MDFRDLVCVHVDSCKFFAMVSAVFSLVALGLTLTLSNAAPSFYLSRDLTASATGFLTCIPTLAPQYHPHYRRP